MERERAAVASFDPTDHRMRAVCARSFDERGEESPAHTGSTAVRSNVDGMFDSMAIAAPGSELAEG